MPHDRVVALQLRTLRMLQATGLHHVLPPLGRGVIFAGHRVAPMAAERAFEPNRALTITPDFLDALLAHLARRGIPVVPLSEVVGRLSGSGGRGLFACFTFDDGYADNFEHAFPVFQRHGAPFAVYLTTGLLDGSILPWWALLEAAVGRAARLSLDLDGPEGRWTRSFALADDAARRAAFGEIAGRLNPAPVGVLRQAFEQLVAQVPEAVAAARTPMLSQAQIAEMRHSGLVEFGAHTVHHVRLGRQTDAVARSEMQASLRHVEALVGRPVDHFAYPYGNAGSYGTREVGLAAQMGFRTAVTTRKALLTQGDLRRPYELPRVSLNGHFQDLGLFDLFLSGLPFVGERLRRLARPAASETAHAA
ncbi:polysaccharide deacetylase family protein [Zavarzinia sp. CC-PAN008]|uniref:polysaccharide deacetylase family protein n=1 Tax=Zavarzinia sp. CC-PAN008 TaxID=3243332 RepID=UPI003F7432B7